MLGTADVFEDGVGGKFGEDAIYAAWRKMSPTSTVHFRLVSLLLAILCNQAVNSLDSSYD